MTNGIKDTFQNEVTEPSYQGCYAGKSDAELVAMGWPADFCFDNDGVCKKIFRPFIERQMLILKDYDRHRNKNSTYEFYVHAYDAAHDVKDLCLYLGLPQKVADNMYYATLIHDIGKTSLPINVWDQPQSPSAEVKQKARSHGVKGIQKFREFLAVKSDDIDSHPFALLAIDMMRNHHQRMDRLSPGEDLSLPVRLMAIVEDYDGRRHLRPHHIGRGDKNDPYSIHLRMQEKCQGWFDKKLYAAFIAMKIAAYNQYNNTTTYPFRSP